MALKRALPELRRSLCRGVTILSLIILAVGFTELDTAEDAYRSKHYETAYQLFSVAADRGSARAQFMLGGLYERGLGTAVNLTEALHQYRLAANQGYVSAQVEIARMLDEGLGGSADRDGAYTWLVQAADTGDGWAQLALAEFLLNRRPTNENIAWALKLYGWAASAGIREAYEALATIYKEGKLAHRDEVLATSFLRKSAEAGNIWSMLDYADRVYQGKGAPRDLEIVEQWLRKAGLSETPAADFALGQFLADNPDHALNPAEANQWLRRAADAGVEWAMVRLGNRLTADDAVADRDLNDAVKYFRSAAALGNGDAILWLAEAYDGKYPGLLDKAEALHWYLEAVGDTKDPNWIFRVLAERYENGIGAEVDLRLAAQWYSKAADAGDDEAQFWLGNAFSIGTGVEKDAAKATSWYLRAATIGNAAARQELRERLEKGIGAREDIAAAAKWYRIDARQGQAEAQLWLAEKLQAGINGPPDEKQALYWYVQAAKTIHSDWLSLEIAQRFEKGVGTEIDLAEAAKWYRTAALEGSIVAQMWMAEALDENGTLPPDPQLASFYYRWAANNGDKWAMLAIAQRLEDGIGTRRDIRDAEYWYVKAARENVVGAMVALGSLYLRDEDGVADTEKALHWLQQAVAQKNATAQFQLGRLYLAGFGVPKDDRRAFDLFKTAAEQGNSHAQFAVASAYYHGIAVEINLAQAYYWWSLASEKGEPGAELHRDEVAKQLAPDILSEMRAKLAGPIDRSAARPIE
jgi:uncharacterized protein